MNQPRISIIIPAYNAESTLVETLVSLQAQTHGAWEAIVVDDGSADRTLAIAADVAAGDDRVRVIAQANGGESAARNAGVALANGDWLVFLDADDWLLPTYLERMTAALATDPEADFVHCGWVRVAIDGHQSQGVFAPREQAMFPDLARRNCFAIHACMVRRSLVDDVGGFDRRLKTCPDWDLWQRIARTGPRFAWVPEVLACYRLRPFSAATDAAQFLRDGIAVIARGREPDPRVLRPDHRYAQGMPVAGAAEARLEHVCWCAGVAIGQGQPAVSLLESVVDDRAPVTPELVAGHLLAAVPVPKGQLTAAWPLLWPRAEAGIDSFLAALEARTKVVGLAERSKSRLMCDILRWAVPEFVKHHESVARSLASIEDGGQHVPDWKRVAAERAVEIAEQQAWIRELETAKAWHEAQRLMWQQRAETAEQEPETARAGHEAQRLVWQQRAEAAAQELETARAWHEAQQLAWQQRAETAEQELETARGWHEAQQLAWQQRTETAERQLGSRKALLRALWRSI